MKFDDPSRPGLIGFQSWSRSKPTPESVWATAAMYAADYPGCWVWCEGGMVVVQPLGVAPYVTAAVGFSAGVGP